MLGTERVSVYVSVRVRECVCVQLWGVEVSLIPVMNIQPTKHTHTHTYVLTSIKWFTHPTPPKPTAPPDPHQHMHAVAVDITCVCLCVRVAVPEYSGRSALTPARTHSCSTTHTYSVTRTAGINAWQAPNRNTHAAQVCTPTRMQFSWAAYDIGH